jgi:alpha-tubulin suppressor-like RCC1 family protein
MYRGLFRRLPLAALAIPAALMAGCTSESTTGPLIVSIVAVSGLGQSGFVGAPLDNPLVVRAEDQLGRPIEGAIVAWTVKSGGGTVTPSQSVTGADGLASTTFRLGATIGQQAVTAQLGSAQPIDFTATATAFGTGAITFDAAYAGARHSCGVDQGGVAYCWGFNGDGQLGIGIQAPGSGPNFAVAEPTAVVGDLTFAGISGGGFHTCGMTLSYNPYCWGKNVDGRLGNNSNDPSSRPDHVDGVSVFRTMSAGATHTCGLTPGGRLYCWGSNQEGQIGVVDSFPITEEDLAFNTPQQVRADLSFLSASAGGLHSCAVTASGEALCWGNNAAGQLGDLTTDNATVPINVAGGILFASVTAGDRHTCGLTPTGEAFCWGDNSYGQLGSGGGNSLEPVNVSGGQAFATLAAGADHTCGLTTSGVAYCWGRNDSGQLGDGTKVNRFTPVAVGNGLSLRQISAGASHSCGATTAKVAYCWGSNQYGQLGDGTLASSALPVKVKFQP